NVQYVCQNHLPGYHTSAQSTERRYSICKRHSAYRNNYFPGRKYKAADQPDVTIFNQVDSRMAGLAAVHPLDYRWIVPSIPTLTSKGLQYASSKTAKGRLVTALFSS